MPKDLVGDQKMQVVYICQRWSTIIGVYANFDDAAQTAQASIARGQMCHIISKPIL